MIGYQLAYLKAHYPLYFMCGLLTSVIGNEDKISQYLHEAKGSGIQVLPPSINKSGFPFAPENGAVRYSLRAVKNVGVSAVKDIYKARTHKPFEDLFDFCFRVPAKKRESENHRSPYIFWRHGRIQSKSRRLAGLR